MVNFKIFGVLGTPNKQTWPDVVNLPYYKTTFPHFEPKRLEDYFPRLDANGINLLASMLTYDPNKRITAKQALLHVKIFILIIYIH